MTTDERIITAVEVRSGEYVDGTEFDTLLERTKQRLHQPKYMGTRHISEKTFWIQSRRIAEAYIPVSASSYKVNEEMYSYNKDSDEWFCLWEITRSKRNGKQLKNAAKHTNCLATPLIKINV